VTVLVVVFCVPIPIVSVVRARHGCDHASHDQKPDRTQCTHGHATPSPRGDEAITRYSASGGRSKEKKEVLF
jgi:hypothetical protein